MRSGQTNMVPQGHPCTSALCPARLPSHQHHAATQAAPYARGGTAERRRQLVSVRLPLYNAILTRLQSHLAGLVAILLRSEAPFPLPHRFTSSQATSHRLDAIGSTLQIDIHSSQRSKPRRETAIWASALSWSDCAVHRRLLSPNSNLLSLTCTYQERLTFAFCCIWKGVVGGRSPSAFGI
jgi:hypothetical protein